MAPNFNEFFLNSGSNIVQLETIDLTHPLFSRRYLIVRNAIAGLTATLEDSTTVDFDYYPLQITPSGAYNDLDQTLEVIFGDLGELLPQEMDRLTIPSAQQGVPVNGGCLIGAFVDASGNLVTDPFLIGQGGQFYVPWDAVALQMGCNDQFYFDNYGAWSVVINGASPVSVPGTSVPWTNAGGLNPDYPISVSGGPTMTSTPVTPGDLLLVSVSGLAGVTHSDLQNGFGDPSLPGQTSGLPGYFVATYALPGTAVYPQLVYRTFRSDDLSAPMNGPYLFDVVNIAYKKEGATLHCAARRLNLVSTGEPYSVSRFPMLQGFF